jgi:hypothetical protein
MNEEDVKLKIVVPWLMSLGLSVQNLSFETSFKIHIGRQDVVIGGRGSNDAVGARLDILIHRHGKNLAVVEVKRSDAQLTDDDREQAISYAKLLHPPAPLALVTNGSDFRLFNAFTKEPVKPEATLFSQPVPADLPDADRLEALRVFFDCSPANVLAFCQSQVETEITPLLGRPDQYGAVYIPELQVPRADVNSLLGQFLQSAKPVLVLTGESGMGKTCAMVDIARSLVAVSRPTLFFRASMLPGDIVDAMSLEFGFAFTDASGPIATLRRIAASAKDQPLNVVVDSLEDWSAAQRVQYLAQLIKHAASANVRLILSCKTRSWDQFLAVKREPTGIEPSIHGAADRKPFSHQIESLSQEEFHAAVNKHRKVYAVNSTFEGKTFDAAKGNPFFLRLLFQVAALSQTPRLTFESPEFFERYLDLATSRTSAPDVAKRTLDIVAGLQYDSGEDWIDEHACREALRLGIQDAILPDLFEHRLLVDSFADGVRRIGFGFGQLRNFIVAFRVRRWQAADAAQFHREAENAGPGLRSEILAFYYPFATLEQKTALDGRVRANAEAYLNLYVEVLTEHFPKLRSLFSPGTAGRIGFAAELMIGDWRVGLYGFRPIGEADEPLLFVPVERTHGAERLHIASTVTSHSFGSARGFLSADIPYEIIVNEVGRQLREMATKGSLAETATPALAQEWILGILIRHKDIFGAFLDQKRVPRFPIALADVSAALRRYELYQRYRDQLIHEKRERGELEERRHGPIVSYSINLSAQETALVDSRVEEALRNNLPLRPDATYVEVEKLRPRLERAIADAGGTEAAIQGPLFPLRDEIVTRLRSGERPHALFQNHCAHLLQLALSNYRLLVETNFPTLKEHFPLYRSIPVRLVLIVGPRVLDGDQWAMLYFCRSSDLENEVCVYDAADVHQEVKDEILRTPQGRVEWLRGQSTTAGALLHGRHLNGFEYGEGVLLRKWVYEWLLHDLEKAEEALRARYGVSKSPRHHCDPCG